MLIGFAGLGDAEVDQSITCPSGYTVNAANVNGVDQVWCENAAGARVSATATPIDPAPGTTMNVVSMSFWAALGIVSLAWILRPQRRRR